MNTTNPFEGKAIKFDTSEQLDHLAELARGYGLKVYGETKFNEVFHFFRYSIFYGCYSNFESANLDNTNNTEIHYSGFVASIEAVKSAHTEPTPDMVNHPPHYNVNGIEVIDVIENYKLNYRLGNVVKYVLRSDLKGNRLQDLKKALWYLQREIEQSEKQN